MAEANDSSTPVRIGPGSRLSVAGSTRPLPLVSRVPTVPSRVDSSAVSWWLNTAPNRDTPKEPPIERKNVAELLDTPRSFWSTLFWAMSMVVCMRNPMPTPSTAMNSPVWVRVVCVS